LSKIFESLELFIIEWHLIGTFLFPHDKLMLILLASQLINYSTTG